MKNAIMGYICHILSCGHDSTLAKVGKMEKLVWLDISYVCGLLMFPLTLK